jgi:hypothetical protein
VTQHFLHNTQVGTVLNHVCGKGMTKGMGRYDFFIPALPACSFIIINTMFLESGLP